MKKELSDRLKKIEVKRDQDEKTMDMLTNIEKVLSSKARLLVDEVVLDRITASLEFQQMLDKRILSVLDETITDIIRSTTRAKRINFIDLYEYIKNAIDEKFLEQVAKEEIISIVRQNKGIILQAFKELKKEEK